MKNRSATRGCRTVCRVTKDVPTWHVRRDPIHRVNRNQIGEPGGVSPRTTRLTLVRGLTPPGSPKHARKKRAWFRQTTYRDVRNGEAGRPSAFARFGSASWSQPKRTAAGSAILSLDTITELPSIVAVASTKSPSLPAIVNHDNALPSRAFNPPPA